MNPAWSSADVARELCDQLVANEMLKAKPAFIRTDREAKLAGIFAEAKIDGPFLSGLENAGPIKMLVRKFTQGEPWVDHVVAGLTNMLDDDVKKAKEVMGMDEA